MEGEKTTTEEVLATELPPTREPYLLSYFKIFETSREHMLSDVTEDDWLGFPLSNQPLRLSKKEK